MTEIKLNSSSITEQCYEYMINNDIKKLNVYDFMDYIKPQLGLSEEEFVMQMSYFYTDLNLDGRFVCVEDGSWVLKDTLTVEDVQNFVEPSITRFEIEDEEEIDIYSDEEDEDVSDEVDELVEDEDDDDSDEDDLYGFDEEIVSKYSVGDEEEF